MSQALSLGVILLSLIFSPLALAVEPESSSLEIRKLILGMEPTAIGVTRENFKHPVWGLIMETGFPEGSFTLVALANGTTGLYYSTGGGTDGAGKHASVRAASGHLLVGAQYFYAQAKPVNSYPLPGAGEVKFYFLGFDQVSSYSAFEVDLGEQRDPLSNLFNAGHKLIDELRKVQQAEQ
ncbi:MAG: hypothetical protein ACI9LO_002037 [Planctomycetota bacterium]|jgi:hypothetical protein